MVYPLSVLASSLAHTANHPFHLTVGYLEGTLPAPDREVLRRILEDSGVSHDFVELGTDERFITQGHISPTTFAKFLLADLIPEQHLWLDADTIALPGWDGIFDEIAQAPSPSRLVVAHRPESASRGIGDGLAFNAGVLGWPAGERKPWSEHLSTFEVVDTQEQALFNLLYAHCLHQTSTRYNVLTYSIDQLGRDDPPFIVHYAGAHKPWHLARGLTRRCREYRCPWSAWFDAEDAFLRSASPGLTATIQELHRKALRSGTLRWRRDHSGFILLRVLSYLGPLGGAVVGLLTLGGARLPRGTHPVHPRPGR